MKSWRVVSETRPHIIDVGLGFFPLACLSFQIQIHYSLTVNSPFSLKNVGGFSGFPIFYATKQFTIDNFYFLVYSVQLQLTV